jgi:hypothetical protein
MRNPAPKMADANAHARATDDFMEETDRQLRAADGLWAKCEIRAEKNGDFAIQRSSVAEL